MGLANHTVLIARDGTERPIDDSAAPIRDEAGAPVGAVLVFRDVTERKRAEEAQAERGRLAALRADVAMVLAGGDGLGDVLQRSAERDRPAPGRRLRPDLDARRARGGARAPGQRRALHPPGRAARPHRRRRLQDRPDRREPAAAPDQRRRRRPERERPGVGEPRGDGRRSPATRSPWKGAWSACWRRSRATRSRRPSSPTWPRSRTRSRSASSGSGPRRRCGRARSGTASWPTWPRPPRRSPTPPRSWRSPPGCWAEHLGVDRCAYAEVEDEAVFVITGDHTAASRASSAAGRWRRSGPSTSG